MTETPRQEGNCPTCGAKYPREVEVNVVMGAQLRAIVRSALLHVRNKLDEVTNDGWSLDIIDKEMEKWPLSADPEDTLAQWLWNRFGQYMEPLDPTETVQRWEDLSDDGKQYFEHQAAAVRRAVGRGGFKTSPDEVEISTPVGDLHQAAANSGNMVKSYRQLDLKNAESLGEAIRIAVGAASVTWTNMSGAGVFKSEVALDIATQLEHHFHYLLTLMTASMGERHRALGALLHKYWTAGVPMVSVSQVSDILAGRATPEEYNSPLQVRPGLSEAERQYRKENPNG